jgi:hypothetical protein
LRLCNTPDTWAATAVDSIVFRIAPSTATVTGGGSETTDDSGSDDWAWRYGATPAIRDPTNAVRTTAWIDEFIGNSMVMEREIPGND